MKKKEDNDNSFFGGFEAVVDGLARLERVKPVQSIGPDDSGGFETVTEIGNDIDELPMTEPEEITGQVVKPTKKTDNGLQEEEQEEEEVVEDIDEEEVTPVPAPTGTADVSDLGEYEKDVVDFFTERFNTELGWELDNETKPKNVGEVIEYIKELVESNSQPQYANDEIARLNKFVAEGGDLRTFYTEAFGDTDLDNIDITNESAQKRVLTDNLSRLGYTPDRVKKLIDRYEDAGTLQEEAEDAIELLKDHKKNRAEQLLVEQENASKARQKEQQNFLKNVYTSIDKTDSIRGIPISVKEKKDLADYIFKPEADGLTKYQKDYAKDYRNLIESAYFTMKGDSLIQKVTQKATSQAAKNLQDKLANKGKRVKNSGTTHGDQGSTLGAWDTVSRQLRRPNF
jgi:hypothetical protein